MAYRALRPNPMWRRAPLLLTLYPVAGVAVSAAIVVLVLASTSAPLFISSISSAAFERTLDASSSQWSGFRASGPGAADSRAASALDEHIRSRAAGLSGLSEPVSTLSTTRFQELGTETGLRALGGSSISRAALYTRDDALKRIGSADSQAEAGRGGATWREEPNAESQSQSPGSNSGLTYDEPGVAVWIPEELADELGLRVGDPAELVTGAEDGRGGGGASTEAETVSRVLVMGTYRNPYLGGRLAESADFYWVEALASVPRLPRSTRIPPLILTDRESFLTLADAAAEVVYATWEVPLADPALPLSAARVLAADLDALAVEAVEANEPLGAAVRAYGSAESFRVESALPEAIDSADEIAAALVSPLQTLSLAAQLLSLGVVAAAVSSLGRQRHGELRLLTARGASPLEISLRAPLEVLPAVVAGATVGWLISEPLVQALGPSPVLDPGRVSQAREFAGLAVVASLVVSAAALAAYVRVVGRPVTSAMRTPAGFMYWEVPVLVLAAAGGYQLLRGGGRTPGPVDLLVIAFPLLAIAGSVGLMARAMDKLLQVASGLVGGSAPVAIWLAARRLRHGSPQVLVLTTAAGTALGLFLYSATLAGSVTPSIDAKSAAILGAEASQDLFASWELDPPINLSSATPDGIGVVWRDTATVRPSGLLINVLAIDPPSFASVALWRGSFGAESVDAALDLLQSEDSRTASTLPVLSVGQISADVPVPSAGTLFTREWGDVGFRVVDNLNAFPGMGERPATIIVNARHLFPLIGPADPTLPPELGSVTPAQPAFRAELWSAVGAEHLRAFMLSRGLPPGDVRSRAEILGRPQLLAQTWSLTYLVVLGGSVGLLAIAALSAFIESRRRQRQIAFALAHRMGLTRLSDALATAIELLTLLAMAFITGALSALSAAWIAIGRLDPLPDTPPPPQIVWPASALSLAAVAAGAISVLAIAVLQWRARRSSTAEVLRALE